MLKSYPRLCHVCQGSSLSAMHVHCTDPCVVLSTCKVNTTRWTQLPDELLFHETICSLIRWCVPSGHNAAAEGLRAGPPDPSGVPICPEHTVWQSHSHLVLQHFSSLDSSTLTSRHSSLSAECPASSWANSCCFLCKSLLRVHWSTLMSRYPSRIFLRKRTLSLWSSRRFWKVYIHLLSPFPIFQLYTHTSSASRTLSWTCPTCPSIFFSRVPNDFCCWSSSESSLNLVSCSSPHFYLESVGMFARKRMSTRLTSNICLTSSFSASTLFLALVR